MSLPEFRHWAGPTEAEVEAQLIRRRRNYPEISEDEALTDLFHLGLKCQRTYAAFGREERRREDRAHGVIESIEDIRGAVIEQALINKPGVHKFRYYFPGNLCYHIGYCTQSELRVALEQKICTRAKP